VDESNGASLVRKLVDVSKIKSIYILCSDQSMQAPWTIGCEQANCIFTDLSSICERIEMSIRDNSIGFNITDASFISSTTIDVNNKQDVMFMYGQLLKDVLTKMDYSTDNRNDIIEFFKDKYKGQPENIKQFTNNYASETPIWWYTKYPFIFETLNLAL
jgi:hypothetical protein